MNSINARKLVFITLLLVLCNFCFAQNIKVIGIIPGTNTGKTYQLQIGAFRLTVNINTAAGILSKNGFTPQYEKIGELTRVFVVCGASEVRAVVNRLGRAGFKEVVIREYAVKDVDVKPAEVVKAEPEPVEKEISFDYTPEFELEELDSYIEIPIECYEEPDHDLAHLFELE